MTQAAAIFFTFVGTDEGDDITGAADEVGYNAADDSITGSNLRPATGSRGGTNDKNFKAKARKY